MLLDLCDPWTHRSQPNMPRMSVTLQYLFYPGDQLHWVFEQWVDALPLRLPVPKLMSQRLLL
jgi:hypothetical protein